MRALPLLLVCVAAVAIDGDAAGPAKHEPDAAFASLVIVQSSRGLGAGTVVDRAERLVLTTWHGTGGQGPVKVYFPMYDERGALVRRGDVYNLAKEGRGVRGDVLIAAPQVDLCVVRSESVPESSPGLKLPPASAAAGDPVILAGQPFTLTGVWQFERGRVDEVRRVEHPAIPGLNVPTGCETLLVKLDLPIGVGYSGGPVVNRANQLVGIIVRGNPETAYCVDVSEVKALLIETYLRLALGYQCGDPERAAACRAKALALAAEAPHLPVNALFGFALREGPRQAVGAAEPATKAVAELPRRLWQLLPEGR